MVAAQSGDVVVAPAGVAHTFRVESTDARWLVLTRVRSVERYEDFARAVAAYPEVSPTEPPKACAGYY